MAFALVRSALAVRASRLTGVYRGCHTAEMSRTPKRRRNCWVGRMFDLKTFDPTTLVVLAALNPAVIVVGFWMGLKADQWQKLIVAALAASLAGFLLLYFAILVGAVHTSSIGGEAGIVLLQVVFGLAWALAGFLLAKRVRRLTRS